MIRSLMMLALCAFVGCMTPAEPLSVDNVSSYVDLEARGPGVSVGTYGSQEVTYARDVSLLSEDLQALVRSSGEDIAGPLIVTADLMAGPSCSGGGSTCSCGNGCVCIATDSGCACGCGPSSPPAGY